MVLDTVIAQNTVGTYLLALGMAVLGIIAGKLFNFIFKTVIGPLTAGSKTDLDDSIAKIIEMPLRFFIYLYSLIYAYNLLIIPPFIDAVVERMFYIVLVILGCMVGIQIIDLILLKVLTPLTKKTKTDFDDHLIVLLRKTVKVILVILALIMVLDNFGFDITTVLAGLGVGGLAFALAAKDMLSNFFGGVSIFLDGPFKIGDRIKMDTFDGTVETIGLRTTKIRTLDDRLLTVPNAKLADNVVENISRENARKIIIKLGLTYDTPIKKIERAQKIIKDVVRKNKSTKDESLTAFTEFADSSLNILVIYWIRDKDSILKAQDEVNLAIKRAFEKEKINFAFPTRTVELINKTRRKK